MTKEKIIEEMKQCLQAIELHEKGMFEKRDAWMWCNEIIKKAEELKEIYYPPCNSFDGF